MSWQVVGAVKYYLNQSLPLSPAHKLQHYQLALPPLRPHPHRSRARPFPLRPSQFVHSHFVRYPLRPIPLRPIPTSSNTHFVHTYFVQSHSSIPTSFNSQFVHSYFVHTHFVQSHFVHSYFVRSHKEGEMHLLVKVFKRLFSNFSWSGTRKSNSCLLEVWLGKQCLIVKGVTWSLI